VIPSPDELAAGWSFVARRHGLKDAPNHAVLESVVQLATTCAAGVERDEPAALFFALARHPSAFEDGWRVACEVLPMARAATLGQRLDATAFELADLRLAAYAGRKDYDSIRTWFADRLRPRE
jgi:hypothetical protein